eukprot:7845173-Lingulodinium_polyedra.AAC.1
MLFAGALAVKLLYMRLDDGERLFSGRLTNAKMLFGCCPMAECMLFDVRLEAQGGCVVVAR